MDLDGAFNDLIILINISTKCHYIRVKFFVWQNKDTKKQNKNALQKGRIYLHTIYQKGASTKENI